MRFPFLLALAGCLILSTIPAPAQSTNAAPASDNPLSGLALGGDNGPTPASPAAPVHPAADGFVHPGILTGADDLAIIQKRVDRHDESDAIYQGWESVLHSRFANVDLTPHPFAIVERKPKDGEGDPAEERNEAMTAYTLTLMWVCNHDTHARDKALEIMNAWAAVFQTHRGDENRYLDSGWVLPVWCSAGELMRYGSVRGEVADWKTDDEAKFEAMIRALEANSVKILKGFNPNSNWGTTSFLADMSAGVFLGDHKMYARGKAALLEHMPKIITQDGYCNEVFRDAWHGTVALTGAIQAAEIARHQGDESVYLAQYDGQSDPRLLVAIRWYANPLRGIGVPMPPMTWKKAAWTYNSPGAARSIGGFEIALNYFTYLHPSPNLDDIRDAVLKTYRPSGQDNGLFIESDTLTHGDLNKKDN